MTPDRLRKLASTQGDVTLSYDKVLGLAAQIEAIEEQARSHALDAAGWEESCAGARAERDAALAQIERLQNLIRKLDQDVRRDGPHDVLVRRDALLALTAEALA